MRDTIHHTARRIRTSDSNILAMSSKVRGKPSKGLASNVKMNRVYEAITHELKIGKIGMICNLFACLI